MNELARRRLYWLMRWLDSGETIIRHRMTRAAVAARKRGWQILDVDNYNRDYQTEYFIEGDFETEAAAKVRRDELTAMTMTVPGGRFRRYTEDAYQYLTVRHASKNYYVFDGY